MLAKGDSMSANSWMQKETTKSLMGQNVLWFHTEYTRNQDIAIRTDHISGKLNIVANGILRVHETYTPHKPFIFDTNYAELIQQVCSQFNKLKSWRIFLPNPEIISDMRWIFSSTSAMEVPERRQNLGQFVHAERTFFGTAANAESWITYFL